MFLFFFFVLNAQPAKGTTNITCLSPFEKAQVMRVEENNLALVKLACVASVPVRSERNLGSAY